MPVPLFSYRGGAGMLKSRQAGCHGAGSRATPPVAAELQLKPPRLAGREWRQDTPLLAATADLHAISAGS